MKDACINKGSLLGRSFFLQDSLDASWLCMLGTNSRNIWSTQKLSLFYFLPPEGGRERLGEEC